MADSLDRLSSALAGRYAIERQIGQGGMATVYLARELRHERPVALKVLNSDLGVLVGTDRFLAEIRVTANLQHPHLLPLFDSGEADGQLFYVMPYVDGESLRQRLVREKQLGIDEALRIAVAVGGAVDYAHRHGVIHRDLKPENILLQDGQPLVADFGIALAVSNAAGTRLTQTGMSLGTPQYMSPEQAIGDRAIDGRTDIYSLGAVLYEMLTGEPPHTGSTAQAIVAKVMTDRPRRIRLAREMVPLQVEAAVDCALAKLPADRFATAAEFVAALQGARATTHPAAADAAVWAGPRHLPEPRTSRITALLPWTLATMLGVVLVAVLVWPDEPRPVTRLVLALNEGLTPRAAPGTTIDISRDGSRVVFTTLETGGVLRLRELDDLDSRPIRGTYAATSPVFSPDARSVLYSSDGRLKQVRVEGGTPVTVSDSGGTAAWGDDDVIVFARTSGLYQTTSTGAAHRRIATPDTTRGLTRFAWPHLLPGSRVALVTVFKRGSGIGFAHLAAVRLDDGRVTELGVEGTAPRYVGGGYIVFGRAGGSVFAARFDARRLRIDGPAVAVLDEVIVKGSGAVELAVAANGTLLHRSGTAARRLITLDRARVERAVLPDLQEYAFPRFSPDGRRIAVSITSSSSIPDTWIYDTRSRALTRLTQSGGDRPEWSADGMTVYTLRQDPDPVRIMAQPWDASSPPLDFLRVRDRQVFSVSTPRTGRGFLAARVGAPDRDIWIAPVDSPQALRPFIATPAEEMMPSVSPDGRWLAYVSNESGRSEVYVRRMPGPSGRVQLSTDGGTEPAWGTDGQTIYYRTVAALVRARLSDLEGSPVITREVLFDGDFIHSAVHRNYDVSADGQRFIFTRPGGAEPRTIVTFNWFEELRARVDGRRL